MATHQATPCIHRWVLGEPCNESVEGVCRWCGARRTFPSWLEVPEAVPDYEELAASRPVLSGATVAPEYRAFRLDLGPGGPGASLS